MVTIMGSQMSLVIKAVMSCTFIYGSAVLYTGRRSGIRHMHGEMGVLRNYWQKKGTCSSQRFGVVTGVYTLLLSSIFVTLEDSYKVGNDSITSS
jgi:hypothetical protein